MNGLFKVSDLNVHNMIGEESTSLNKTFNVDSKGQETVLIASSELHIPNSKVPFFPSPFPNHHACGTSVLVQQNKTLNSDLFFDSKAEEIKQEASNEIFKQISKTTVFPSFIQNNSAYVSSESVQQIKTISTDSFLDSKGQETVHETSTQVHTQNNKMSVSSSSSQKKHICDTCGKEFKNKHLLYNHVGIHNKERPFTCDVCNKSFRVRRTLLDHVMTHTKEKPHACGICNKVFSQKKGLKRHILTHGNEKLYSCDICNRRFTVRSNLKLHFRSHTKEKPNVCDICGKAYGQKTSLTRHLIIHTNEFPYKCETCSRAFKDKSSLTRHIYIHTNLRPHVCETCGKQFIQKYSLQKHLGIHVKRDQEVDAT